MVAYHRKAVERRSEPRRVRGREGDHGQQSGEPVATVLRDSRQPARGSSWERTGPIPASCPACGAEVGGRVQHGLARDDDGRGSERWKSETSISNGGE